MTDNHLKTIPIVLVLLASTIDPSQAAPFLADKESTESTKQECNQPASGQPTTNLESGKQLYKEEKYREARGYLEQAVKEFPKSWEAHFYLAHCNFALGQMAKAKYHYANCKSISTHPTVQAHCDKALALVESHYSKPTPKVEEGEAESEESSKTPEPTQEDTRKQKIEEKREKILKEAREKCSKIRQAADAQVKQEKTSSQQIFRYPDGTIGTDISDERTAQIHAEAEEKCKRIMDVAENRARSYR